MPRFYFDVRRAGVTDKDEEGVLLPSKIIARAEATRTAVDMVRDAVPQDAPDLAIAVRDEHGQPLFEVQALVQVREY